MPKNFVVHPDFLHLKPQLQQAIYGFSHCEGDTVASGRNVVKNIKMAGAHFSFKKFKRPKTLQAFVYRFIRPSKAARSFLYAQKLLGLGIGTPQPVAYFEHFKGGLQQSFYISRHVAHDLDFRVLVHKPDYPGRTEILKQFTAFCHLLHEKHVDFLDHSPGNTLIVKKGNGAYGFYLIDLNRMKFRPMDFNQRMKNLRRLWLSKTMLKTMAATYAQLSKRDSAEVFERMAHYSQRFKRTKTQKKICRQIWRRKVQNFDF
ncbi:MAG: lipopolysaccharide kinase InaA family protein [Marinirhabdus sp.]